MIPYALLIGIAAVAALVYTNSPEKQNKKSNSKPAPPRASADDSDVRNYAWAYQMANRDFGEHADAKVYSAPIVDDFQPKLAKAAAAAKVSHSEYQFQDHVMTQATPGVADEAFYRAQTF